MTRPDPNAAIAASRKRNLDGALARQRTSVPADPTQSLKQPQSLTPGTSQVMELPQLPDPDEGTTTAIENPTHQEPPNEPINPATGRPFPKISPALQAHIQAKMREAQEIQPLSTEIVPVPGPTKEIPPPQYTPRKDTDTAIADLPSRYVFYDFQELYVGKFRLPHFAKLHESYISQSYAYLIEAVSDVLDTPHPDWQGEPLGFHLTIPDFYWVLYFLRLNQIKTHLTHTTTCQNPQHILDVEEGRKEESTLKITMNVYRSNIHTRILESAPDMSHYEFDTFRLKPALMMDVMEAMSDPEYQTSVDMKYMCRAASMIQIKDDPKASLKDRVKFMQGLDFDELIKIGEFEKITSNYGPNEYVQVTCGECGHQRRSKITLDARSFLPI